MKRLLIIAAIVAAIGYYFWKKERNARSAADVAAARADKEARDPFAAVKASTDGMIERANALVAAVKGNPALAGPLGLSKMDADRVLLSSDAFGLLYNQLPFGSPPALSGVGGLRVQ